MTNVLALKMEKKFSSLITNLRDVQESIVSKLPQITDVAFNINKNQCEIVLVVGGTPAESDAKQQEVLSAIKFGIVEELKGGEVVTGFDNHRRRIVSVFF